MLRLVGLTSLLLALPVAAQPGGGLGPLAATVDGVAATTFATVRGASSLVLADGARAEGVHTATFDGAELPAAVYVWRLVAGGTVETGRVTLVR